MLKTQGPFVRRDGHWSKGLNKNTCWVTDQPPGLSIIQLSGSNELFQYSEVHNGPHHCSYLIFISGELFRSQISPAFTVSM